MAPSSPLRVLIGTYFYPRGGSAHVCRSIARELGARGARVKVVAGSRSDLAGEGKAADFYAGLDLHAVDFTPALDSGDPLRWSGPPGTAPMHGSYEDRPDAPDAVLASLSDADLELHVDAWARELAAAGRDGVDLLYLHHLTPLHAAAARAFPGVPIVTHVHGTELLMLERIRDGAPAGWAHADAWARRLREWAATSERILINSPRGVDRAVALLEVEPERVVQMPNGYDPRFAPGEVDRRSLWRRVLVDEPRGWRPGGGPGSVAYREQDLAPLDGTVLAYVGRFTEVKRLPLLIEAFAAARARIDADAGLVLIGGHPGEWEGEHPLEAIERLGCRGAFLAGWYTHEELPELLRGADLLVHPSVREQFGQVLIEAMATGLPVIAVDRGGPATIVDDPATGWLLPPDDVDALADAIVAAVNDAEERRARGRRALEDARRRFSWERIGGRLLELLEAAGSRRGGAGG